jgi:hypothetical protein
MPACVTRIFQEVTTHPTRADWRSEQGVVDVVSERLRAAPTERLQELLSEHDVRNPSGIDSSRNLRPRPDDRPDVQRTSRSPLGGRVADELRARITAIIAAKGDAAALANARRRRAGVRGRKRRARRSSIDEISAT